MEKTKKYSKGKIFKVIPLLTALLVVFVLGGCSNNEKAVKMTTQRRVIIDTDTAVDDAIAIMMAGRAENITIEGVTVLSGNVTLDQAADNALMCLEVCGREDVPVFKGSHTKYSGEERKLSSVFGSDGMGDAGLIHPKGKASDISAIDFIIDTVNSNPGEIEIVCLGPLTNIALAIEKEPDIMKKVKSLIVMGTTGFGHGNATPAAEFNVFCDAKAYKRVIDEGIPVYVVGSDVCESPYMVFTDEIISDWKKGSECQKFLAESFKVFRDHYYVTNKNNYIIVCDPVAMYAAIFDNAVSDYIQCGGLCITDQGPTYGQVLFYVKGVTYDSTEYLYKGNYNMYVATGYNDENYFKNIERLLK